MLRRMVGAAAAQAAAFVTAIFVAGALAATSPALAQLGQPTPGELGLQPPATDLMEQLHTVYDVVNLIIIAIALFVLFLMIYVMYRFSEKKNPQPSRTTHNTLLEVAWTVIPILILAGISIPSFRLLYDQYSFPKPDLTIKAIGNAWYWDHEYIDNKFTVSSNVISDEDVIKEKIGDDAFNEKYGALEGIPRNVALYEDSAAIWVERKQPRKLAVDNEIAIPLNKVVHLLVTSQDVIHSWTIPAFGVKMQAVPGRTAALWFRPNKTGTFYGQCSVLCGKLHSAMPITVRVVEQGVYDSWVEALKAKDRKRAKEILKADAEKSAGPKPVAMAEPQL